MKPPAEYLRLSSQARDQLIKLKRLTGIEHWNTICRWALCVSLREETPPPVINIATDGGEMTWKVFAGENSDAYAALICMRAQKDGLLRESDGLTQCLRLHVHRGLGYLASDRDSRSISAFMKRWLEDDRFQSA